MRKLLSANFARLFKSREFRLGLGVMCGFGILAVIMRYRDTLLDPESADKTADALWFLGGLFISIALSVVISFWIGTEYHDGTVRNKVIVGHTRGEIYAANWLTCTAASLMMYAGYILTLFVCGTLLLEPFATPVRVLALSTLASLPAVAAMSSVFVMIAMLVSRKSTGAVIAMMTALVMLLGAITVYSRLSAPEYHENTFEMAVNGEIVPSDPIPNPKYLRGAEREVYQFIQDFQPVGQMMQFNAEENTPDHIERFPAYSLLLTAVTTGIGTMLFRRKDLK
ncbi:MAG: ABC transporter permease subunit [Clostridia bacterium]|nr:ABC transporter permease subunit [Clostridia bacterium]MBR5365951.1 ABC transporter permease subunit [Clostridia bacterium]